MCRRTPAGTVLPWHRETPIRSPTSTGAAPMSTWNHPTNIEFGGPATYRIVVQGALSETSRRRFAGMTVESGPGRRRHPTHDPGRPCPGPGRAEGRARRPLRPAPAGDRGRAVCAVNERELMNEEIEIDDDDARTGRPGRSCLLAGGLACEQAPTATMNAPPPKMKMTTEIPASIKIPDVVETRLGTLRFEDGFPTEETAQKIYDQLDFQRAVESVILTTPAALVDRIPQRHPRVRSGQRSGDHLGRAHGLQGPAADAQHHGDLRLPVAEPEGRADGGGGPAQGAGADRRLLVPLRHRLRHGRAGPGPGRQVPHPAARTTRARCPRATTSRSRRPTATGCSSAASWRTAIPNPG